MIVFLFLFLVLACLVAPYLSVDTSDARSERAHPKQGWFPLLRDSQF